MDLSAMLNDDNDDENKRPRQPSGTHPRQQTLPTLRTGSHRPSNGTAQNQHSVDNLYTPQLSSRSPSIQLLTRPDGAQFQSSPFPFSPGGPSNYPQTAASPSQYGTPGGTLQYPQNGVPSSPYTSSTFTPGGSQLPQGYRQPSHPSLASTPSSSAYPHTPYAHHESPVSTYAYPNQAVHNQAVHYPQQSFNQPETPRRAPSGPFRLPSHGSRDSPGPLSAMQSPSSVPYASPGALYRPSPQPNIGHMVNGPALHQRVPPPLREKSSSFQERERTLSVSPKTVLGSLPSRGPSISDGRSNHNHEVKNGAEQGPSAGCISADHGFHPRSSSGIASTHERSGILIDPMKPKPNMSSSPDSTRSARRAVDDHAKIDAQTSSIDAGNPQAADVQDVKLQKQHTERSSPDIKPALEKAPIKSAQVHTVAHEGNAMPSPEPPKLKLKRERDAELVPDKTAKRRRVAEIPIWAQRCKATTPLKKYQRSKTINGTGHVESAAYPVSGPSATESVTLAADFGPLGKLEPSFTNIIQYSEITRAISDFLFMHVVTDETLHGRSAGGPSDNAGLLEIEAKIGTIIDRKTEKRLNLPISTEAILKESDPSLNIAFESTMSPQQHEMFNRKLNDALRQSNVKGQGLPRQPMKYVHTRERDSFYVLPPSEMSSLPPGLVQLIGSQRKPKLRVTRDQQTGKAVAQIVKHRIANLHVYSPNTPFDWRISVSAEVEWNGDLKRLMQNAAQQGNTGVNPDRNKDRVSYKHQYCQIDLTQVKPTSGNEPPTHELEVELDATVLRQQGQLVGGPTPNSYEDLVQSFADNVRALARTK